MTSIWKKILVAGVLLSFVLNISGLAMFSAPKKAEAAWPTSEILSVPTFIQIMKDLGMWIKDQLLDALRDAVISALVAKLQNDIINKVTGGGGGYVSDWSDYLKDSVINTTFSKFNSILNKDTGIDLCVPFAQQFLSVRLNSLAASYGVGQSNLGLPVRCSFDNFRDNLQYSYDFITRGGWASYDALFSPDVNPYWISWQMEDKFAQLVAEQKEAKKSEAESSGGFLGLKECADPGAQQQAEEFCADNEGGANTPGYAECVKRVVSENCTSWGVKTPGQAVSEAVTKALGTSFDLAENYKTAISAVINVLISKALEKGLQSASSEGGTKVERDAGDLDGTGFEDYEGQTYRQDLEDANRDYDDIIYYITHDLAPVVSQTLTLAHDIDGTDLENCPNTRISVDDGSGTKKMYTVAEIIDLLNGFDLNDPNSAASRALAQARVNQAEITDLLNQDVPSGTDVNRVVNKLSNFVRTYQPFYTDVQLINNGSDGELVTLIWNIYNALRALNNQDNNNKNDLICR